MEASALNDGFRSFIGAQRRSRKHVSALGGGGAEGTSIVAHGCAAAQRRTQTARRCWWPRCALCHASAGGAAPVAEG